MAETESKPKLGKYVVMVGAVVVTVGRKPNGRPEFVRVLKGGVLNGNPQSQQIKDFERKGAVVRARDKTHMDELRAEPLRTARQVSQSMGAPDDPVQAPQAGILPVHAPNPETDPEKLKADA